MCGGWIIRLPFCSIGDRAKLLGKDFKFPLLIKLITKTKSGKFVGRYRVFLNRFFEKGKNMNMYFVLPGLVTFIPGLLISVGALGDPSNKKIGLVGIVLVLVGVSLASIGSASSTMILK
jgi:hypothetical protein